MGHQIPSVALPGFHQLLAELVGLSSISSPEPSWDQGNIDVINRLADWFNDLGFEVEIMRLPHAPNKANMIATLGKGERGLVLSGHTDTVPFDQKSWQSDPFKLAEREQKLFGLGTCDMKGFFPIIIEALRNMEGAELEEPLIVLATADEESSMSGARALAEQDKIKGRAAVIGEPTSIMPIRMHKGIMMEAIRVSGHTGHSSNPALGNNAMEAMNKVMSDLLAYRNEIQSRYQNPLFDVPFPTLNLGHIHGGDSPNRICGHCELSFDLRPLPGMNIQELKEDIARISRKVSEKTNTDISLHHLIESVPAFETHKTSELVSLCEKMTHSEAKAVAFATEAPFLNKMGFETIVMGAGSIDQAHQPNEFLALDQIHPMANVLEKLINHYCMV